VNAWTTSVLILLSAADEKLAKLPGAGGAREDTSERDEELPCDASIRGIQCGQMLRAKNMTVCRACFRD
jgi:hypothetical protein